MKPNAKLAKFLKTSNITVDAANHRLVAELNCAYSRVAELEHALDDIRETFQRALSNFRESQSTASSQRVPYRGAFCNINYSTASYMDNWVKHWSYMLEERLSAPRECGCSCTWLFGDDAGCIVHGK